MRRAMKGLYLLPWLLLAPMPAFALDMDFYTYDGFQETVDAFTRLALVMSDSGFTGFAFTFAIAGIVMGGLFFAAKAHMGQANNPIGWFIPILFGMCIYKGLVMPTGTMYIYDPVINANQAVGGVPDIVTFLAGGLNELERDIVTVVDTGSANPYGWRRWDRSPTMSTWAARLPSITPTAAPFRLAPTIRVYRSRS